MEYERNYDETDYEREHMDHFAYIGDDEEEDELDVRQETASALAKPVMRTYQAPARRRSFTGDQ